jgi:hypothetical protein
MMKQRETIISPMVVLMHVGTVDSELQLRSVTGWSMASRYLRVE